MYNKYMLATNHAITGALLGAVLPLPVALPVAFASHVVLDALPHYGIPLHMRNRSSQYKLIVASDICIALIGSVGLALTHRWQMNLCAWVAWSPDLFWVIYVLRHKNLHIKARNWFMKLHQNMQWAEKPWGIFVELAYFALLLPLYIAGLL